MASTLDLVPIVFWKGAEASCKWESVVTDIGDNGALSVYSDDLKQTLLISNDVRLRTEDGITSTVSSS